MGAGCRSDPRAAGQRRRAALEPSWPRLDHEHDPPIGAGAERLLPGAMAAMGEVERSLKSGISSGSASPTCRAAPTPRRWVR